MKVCKIPDCNSNRVGQGFCNKHYLRFQNHGDPNFVKPIWNKHPTGICEIPDCSGKVVGRGFCSKHWSRWKNHGDPNFVKPIWNKHSTGICELPDCNNKYLAQGYCAKHYQRWKNNGDPNVLKPIWNKHPTGVCEISDCNNKYLAQGYCAKHRKRWKEYGDPNIVHKSLEHILEQETYVYRLYDLNNNLLYIGIAKNIQRRFYGHSRKKHWWPEVAKSYIRKYPNREEASRIEKQAIMKYNPLYNSRHNKKAA